MAAQTAVTAQHATLSGTTADSVTFSGAGKKYIRITNRHATNVMYFNVNSGTTPVAAADDVYFVAPGQSITVRMRGDITLCRIVGTDNPYSAELFDTDNTTSGAAPAAGSGTQVSVPATTGGLSVVQLNGSDGAGGVLVATAQAIKAAAGQLYGYYIYNPNSAATFVHFYNTAFGSVTVGTTTPLVSVTIPATAGANLAFPVGVAFSTAISAAATTTAGGNTNPSTGLDVTVFYS